MNGQALLPGIILPSPVDEGVSEAPQPDVADGVSRCEASDLACPDGTGSGDTPCHCTDSHDDVTGCPDHEKVGDAESSVPVHELPLLRWLGAAGGLAPGEPAPGDSAADGPSLCEPEAGELSSDESEPGGFTTDMPVSGGSSSGEPVSGASVTDGFTTGGDAEMSETSDAPPACGAAPSASDVAGASGVFGADAGHGGLDEGNGAGDDGEEGDEAQAWPPFTPDVLASLCTVEVQGSAHASAATEDGDGGHIFPEADDAVCGAASQEAACDDTGDVCHGGAVLEDARPATAAADIGAAHAAVPECGAAPDALAGRDGAEAVSLDAGLSGGSASDGHAKVSESAFCASPEVGDAGCCLPPLTVLGLGTGDTALSPVHESLLRDAEVLVGGRRQLAAFRGHPARQVVIASPVTDALEAVARLREEGRRVVVLADGDPLFFGIGTRVARDFGPDAVRVVPSVSCLQAAAARLGMAWHDTVTVSMHGRDDWRPLAAAVLGGHPVCVLTDGVNTPDRIARHLLDRGVDWFRAHVFEDMGTVEEQAHDLSLAACAALDFGPCCTVLLVPQGEVRGPRTGMPDTFFAAEAGLLTKWPVRAVALAALRVNPADTVWDVGAGSGAMSVECAAVASRGSVWAVERDAARVVCVEENRRRMGAANIEVVHGDAPACLTSLPTPDRVFMGGGLGGISADASCPVLHTVCERLAPGGRVVVACVLLGSLERALGVFRNLGWPAEVVCVQASVSSPLAGDMRLAAFNPVHLVSAARPQTGGQ